MGRKDAVRFTLEWAAEARRLGADVTFQPGWETRGNGTSSDYEGGVVHHTGSPSSQAKPNPALSVLINGRPDLSGPLCNVTAPWSTEDAPVLHVVAAHPANHAGASGGKSMGPLPVTSLFNKLVFGLEIDYAGITPMTAGQYRAALIFARAVTTVLGRDAAWVRGHAETSITGKWDPGYAAGKTIDLAAFRRDVTSLTSPGAFLMSLTADEERRVLQAADNLTWLVVNSLIPSVVHANEGVAAIQARLGAGGSAYPAVAVDAVAVAASLASDPAFMDALAESTAVKVDAKLAARLAS